MRKINRRAVMVLACALVLTAAKFARPATTVGQRLEINICEFTVPPELAQANASFTISYVVQVGDDGRPIKILKVKNDFLLDEPFVACIKSWILPVRNEGLLISLDWRHGQGWTDLAISGESLNYRIAFEPGAFSQYGRAARQSSQAPSMDPRGESLHKEIPAAASAKPN